MGSIPVIRTSRQACLESKENTHKTHMCVYAYLVKLVNTTDLKSVPSTVIGSSPIVSNMYTYARIILQHKHVCMRIRFLVHLYMPVYTCIRFLVHVCILRVCKNKKTFHTHMFFSLSYMYIRVKNTA